MKQTILVLALAIGMLQAAFSQNTTIAKLNYEQAEEAYLKEDYSKALRKLEESETKFGKINPPILYLRIMAQNKLINKNDSIVDLFFLSNARKNCEIYLKEYEKLPNIEDKYREVYLVYENLNDNYPKTEEEWKLKMKLGADELAKKEKSIEFAKKLMQRYKYKNGLTVNEFIQYNPESAYLFRKKGTYYKKSNEFNAFTNYRGDFRNVGPYNIFVEEITNEIYHFVYQFAVDKKQEIFNKSYDGLAEEIKNNISPEFVKSTPEVEGSVLIIIPDFETTISIYKLNMSEINYGFISFTTIN